MRFLQGAIQTVTSEYLHRHGRDWVYPVYHGSTQENLRIIYDVGFKDWSRENIHERRNGFSESSRWDGPSVPPVHFLGMGTYFTESKGFAKLFSGGSAKNLKKFAIQVDRDRLCTINFASERTMMKWWRSYGYDPEAEGQVDATWTMTDNLKREFDAVYYKGTGFSRGFGDRNQICVFDNRRVYLIDDSQASGFELGAKVRRKGDGMVGVVVSEPESLEGILDKYPLAATWLKPGAGLRFLVKWNRGGRSSVQDVEVEPMN